MTDQYDEKDPYSILGIDFNATENEIRNAYRSRALQWHPDKHPGESEQWSKKFQLLRDAYSCLNDSTQRHIYNATGSWSGNPVEEEFTFPMGEPQVIFMTSQFPMTGNLFEMFGSFTESGGMENLLTGGFESLLTGLSGDKGHLANVLGQILDPLKEKAKETVHRLQTENRKLETEYERWKTNKDSQPHLFQVHAHIEDLWNEDKPRKKKYKINNEKTIVRLYLGVQKVDETNYVQVEPRDTVSHWVWKWTSTPDKANGYITPKPASWTLLGKITNETKWANVWVNEYESMWVIWCSDLETPFDGETIPDESKPDFIDLNNIEIGGWFYWMRPKHPLDKTEPEKIRLKWHPNPELRERGDGWWIENAGIWFNEDIRGETETIKRSHVKIPLPVLPRTSSWAEFVRKLGDLPEDFEMDTSFGFST